MRCVEALTCACRALKRVIQTHASVQHALLLLVLLGTSMLIGDGVLTCSIEGLLPLPSFKPLIVSQL